MARVVAPADASALDKRTSRGFAAHYACEPEFVVSAPGRANLIGEHTDYNDGFVLPFAIARRTAVAVRRRGDRLVRVASALGAGVVELSLDEPITRGDPPWSNYVRGVLFELGARSPVPLDPGGFDAWIDSDVPVGSGLSSSAALEVAVATAVERLAGTTIDPVEKAELCRLAEHRFAGVPCGIMDQMASVLATTDMLLLLDCQDLTWRRIALPAGEVELVVVDSELPHDLGEGEFAKRVDECRRAAQKLGVASLRDATREQLSELVNAGESVLFRRALHVVEENARVLAAVDAIGAKDWKRLGALLDDSHRSLRDLYEVSRPEMDALVEDLRRAGALGARMTGGGFGGCAVALFPRGRGIDDAFFRRPAESVEQPKRFTETLRNVRRRAADGPVTIGEMVQLCGRRGHAFLAIFLVLPFLQPLPLPGVSSAIGVVLAILGAFVALRRSPWVPARLAGVVVESDVVLRICTSLEKLMTRLEKVVRPRAAWLFAKPWFRVTNGVLWILHALVFALPLPIPLTNTFPAVVILLLAMGILEEDFRLIMLAYAGTILNILFFGGLIALPALGWNAFTR